MKYYQLWRIYDRSRFCGKKFRKLHQRFIWSLFCMSRTPNTFIHIQKYQKTWYFHIFNCLFLKLTKSKIEGIFKSTIQGISYFSLLAVTNLRLNIYVYINSSIHLFFLKIAKFRKNVIFLWETDVIYSNTLMSREMWSIIDDQFYNRLYQALNISIYSECKIMGCISAFQGIRY